MAALVNYETLSASKPTLIFLHGYLDNADSFATLLPLLNNYQCIAIDMAGHGKSEHRSTDAHYHLSDYAYDLYQLVLTLQLSDFVLVGHSLGAIVSSLYSATQPQGLCGFIAIESCGPLSEDAGTTATQLSDCFVSRANANKAIKQPSSIEAVIKARCAVSDLSASQAQQIVSRNLKTDLQGNLQWRTDKRLRTKSPMRMTEEQVCAVLGNICCRRALILGKQGFEKVKVAIAERDNVFFDVPTSTFNGGHHVHLESKVEVADCIHKYATQFFRC
ncbi:MAG: pimeloyl-ACP methyl ester carboxylesterase [Alphaproteobacteria bacterium]|jgi:pimeloyl-ACP methyl ester carboxylesterase